MKNYEAVVIYSPQIAGDILQHGKSIFEGAVQKHGGKISNHADLGKRYLGYAIKSFKEGYGLVFDFELSPDRVESLKQALRLIDEILRFMIVIKPKTSKTPAVAPVHREAPARANVKG